MKPQKNEGSQPSERTLHIIRQVAYTYQLVKFKHEGTSSYLN